MRYASGVCAGPRGIQPTVFAGEPQYLEHRERCLRHARAMKAVLLAVRAWAKAVERLTMALRTQHQPAAEAASTRAAQRLYAAQERLERIEKEVSRG